jgi:hypothetical protein
VQLDGELERVLVHLGPERVLGDERKRVTLEQPRVAQRVEDPVLQRACDGPLRPKLSVNKEQSTRH